MKGFGLVLGLLSTLVSGQEAADLGLEGGVLSSVRVNETFTSRRFIVEFATNSNARVAANGLADKPGLKVLRVFENDIFTGASVQVEEDNLDTLKAADVRIANVWPAHRFVLPPLVPEATWSEQAAGINYSVHSMTGVDKLHAAGIKGKGVNVAVVDTGIDYTHPALGGNFGSGFKVTGGYDLVGDGDYPYGPKVPDDDPMDQLGHGTHVAGIVAGVDNLFTGVAPEANLQAYKVFSTVDGTEEDVLIDAFLMAYDDGADIITSSIGGVNGFPDGAWSTVASRLVEKGVVVTISAGNDGQAGAFAASSGSSGEYVLAIASVDGDIMPTSSFNATFELDGDSNTTKVPYRAVVDWFPSEVKDWEIYPLTLDTTAEDDACSPLPEDTRNLTGLVVLVRRGGCDFTTKQLNLEAFGATNILFYTNEMPLVKPTTAQLGAPSVLAMITREAGKAIIETIKAGGEVTADFSGRPIYTIVGVENEETGGMASAFTSIGATNDLVIKPDIAAPGGNILSSYLNKGYAVLSGTSMSCPYVAGVAALYIGEHGGRATHGPDFAKNLAMRIMTSGNSLPWNTPEGIEGGITASVAQVGTGLVNATKILDYTTSLSFAKFSLNDTHHFSRYHEVDITNNGKTSVTYKFALEDAGTMLTMLRDTTVWGTPRIAWYEEVMAVAAKAVPRFSSPGGTFTVKAGETKAAKFSFMYPEGLDASLLPLYSGKVIISGSNGESLSVPYMGLAANLHRDMDVPFQEPIGFPRITSTTKDIPITTKSNFTFNLTTADFPNLYTRETYATTEMRWDIFDENWTERDWKYPPVIGENGYIGSATSWARAGPVWNFDPEVDDPNDLIALPLKNMPRSVAGAYGQYLWWFGTLANGTRIAPGKYNMRFASLTPFGNHHASDNWFKYKTPQINVLDG